jgi:hypothetical protein
VGKSRGARSVLEDKPEGKNHLEDLVVDGMIILKWILRKSGTRAWSDVGQQVQMAAFCEHGNEPSAAIIYGAFRGWL